MRYRDTMKKLDRVSRGSTRIGVDPEWIDPDWSEGGSLEEEQLAAWFERNTASLNQAG